MRYDDYALPAEVRAKLYPHREREKPRVPLPEQKPLEIKWDKVLQAVQGACFVFAAIYVLLSLHL